MKMLSFLTEKAHKFCYRKEKKERNRGLTDYFCFDLLCFFPFRIPSLICNTLRSEENPI